MVDKDGALVEAVAAKGVVRSSLKLGLLDMESEVDGRTYFDDGVGCLGTLLEMSLVELGGECIGGPCVWMGLIC